MRTSGAPFPPADQLLYERRNGRFVLQITGHPEFGVPFGEDRLVPIFLAIFGCAAEKSDRPISNCRRDVGKLWHAHSGKEYRRLVAAFERVFGATIFFGTDTDTARSKVIQRSRFNFISEAQIWYSRAAGDSRFEVGSRPSRDLRSASGKSWVPTLARCQSAHTLSGHPCPGIQKLGM